MHGHWPGSQVNRVLVLLKCWAVDILFSGLYIYVVGLL